MASDLDRKASGPSNAYARGETRRKLSFLEDRTWQAPLLMLKREDNELLTRVGPSTPMGDLFRRFWLPALLPSEVPSPDCPPVRLRLLGENLVPSATARIVSAFCTSFARTGALLCSMA